MSEQYDEESSTGAANAPALAAVKELKGRLKELAARLTPDVEPAVTFSLRKVTQDE